MEPGQLDSIWDSARGKNSIATRFHDPALKRPPGCGSDRFGALLSKISSKLFRAGVDATVVRGGSDSADCNGGE